MGNNHTQKLIEAFNKDQYFSVKFDFSFNTLINEINISPISHNYYLQKLNRYCRYIDQNQFEKNLKILISKIFSISPSSTQDNDLYLSLSCIFGAFLGDSMGTYCEDKPMNKVNHERIYKKESNSFLSPGTVTDDSEMAMSFSFAVMDSPNLYSLNQNLIFYYYGIWAYSEPISMGNTTANSLFQFNIEKDNITKQNLFSDSIKKKVAEMNKDMLSNGFLMRLSTFIVWYYYQNKKELLKLFNDENYIEIYYNLQKELIKDIEITHPNKENLIVGTIYVFIGICTLFLYKPMNILKKVNDLLKNDLFLKDENILEIKVKNIIENCLIDYKKKDFDKYKYFENINIKSGWYIHSFKLMFYYLYTFNNIVNDEKIENIYSYIIKEICDFGGDTDTNCCIVGAIIGPLIGFFNFERTYFNIFINYYCDVRIQYTNAFMYFYVKYLEDSKTIKKGSEQKEIRYNFIKCLYTMIIGELNNNI